MSKEIKSHIQMPKMMLRRFENEHKQLYSYSVLTGHIANKASAKSVNTQKEYFSENAEQYLSQNIEKPFSEALKEIDQFDFDNPDFEITQDLQAKILHYAYALMSRSKAILEQIKTKSAFSIVLSEQNLHDLAAVNGINAGIENKLWADYYIGFIQNRTAIPFVLPTSGIYGVMENGRETNINIVMPISPRIAIMLRQPHDNEVPYTFFRREEDENTIRILNTMAFEYQCRCGVGYVVSPTIEPLQMIIETGSNATSRTEE